MTRFASGAVIVFAVVLAAVGVSCGGSDATVGGPTGPWVAGEYVTEAHEEVSDSCGFSTSFHQEPWLVTQEVTSSNEPSAWVKISSRDAAMDDGCLDIVVRLDGWTGDYDGAGTSDKQGCVYDWTVHGVVEFSDAGFTLTESSHYAYNSGTCEGWTFPCDYTSRFSVPTCDRCWPGCATSRASGRVTPLP